MEDYAYPLLKRISAYYHVLPHNVSEVYLVCCQHILEPQKHMFEELISFGFDPAKILLLGKTYSTSFEVKSELEALGITVMQPEFSGIAFDQEHSNNCQDLIKMIPQEARCILLDDGAQLIMDSIQLHKNIWFAVEQTSSGFRKLEYETMPFPVLNVARSSTKLTQESPHVARHACERMKEYFFEKRLKEPQILIVGLGPIGEAVREYFAQENLNVMGFDTMHGHTDLLKTINSSKPDVVIGATGSTILSREELEELFRDKPLYLISMSSSDREFPVANYRNEKKGTHIDIDYRNIVFVNNGFPISFKGNRYESLPIEMEKTMCLLGGAVMYGSVTSNLGNGLVELTELEKVINE